MGSQQVAAVQVQEAHNFEETKELTTPPIYSTSTSKGQGISPKDEVGSRMEEPEEPSRPRAAVRTAEAEEAEAPII